MDRNIKATIKMEKNKGMEIIFGIMVHFILGIWNKIDYKDLLFN